MADEAGKRVPRTGKATDEVKNNNAHLQDATTSSLNRCQHISCAKQRSSAGGKLILARASQGAAGTTATKVCCLTLLCPYLLLTSHVFLLYAAGRASQQGDATIGRGSNPTGGGENNSGGGKAGGAGGARGTT